MGWGGLKSALCNISVQKCVWLVIRLPDSNFGCKMGLPDRDFRGSGTHAINCQESPLKSVLNVLLPVDTSVWVPHALNSVFRAAEL